MPIIFRNDSDRPDQPFLKWAGGKRWLAACVAELLAGGKRHVEPFAGSGACFFASRINKGLLSDTNRELIHCFRVVRDNPQRLIARLRRLHINHKTFQRLRQSTDPHAIRRAARFIYLNRTAFNGIYRVNREGGFNVPFGCKPSTVLCDSEALLSCSRRLRDVALLSVDFRLSLARVRPGDVVYIDPPYTVKHNLNAFRRYNEHLFTWDDQVAIASCATSLAAKGIHVVVSNAFHQDVLALYPRTEFHAFALTRPSNMSATAAARGVCEELLLVSRAVASAPRFVQDVLERHSSFPSRPV